MIGRISGRLLSKKPPEILVDVQGVGYEINLPMSSYTQLPVEGQAVSLFTHLVVREDAHMLYGFLTLEEREAFRALIKVSGIGPKIALAVLSGLSVSHLVAAIEDNQAALLAKTPGIGKKTAERLVLELQGKLGHLMSGGVSITTTLNAAHQDILEGLLALGYSEREAKQAVKGLPSDISVNDGLRQALQALTR